MNGPKTLDGDVVGWWRTTLERLVVKAGMAADRAAGIGRHWEESVRDTFGGNTVYIHRAAWFDRNQRDAEIRAERANGASTSELAGRYCLSVSYIRRICGETPAALSDEK